MNAADAISTCARCCISIAAIAGATWLLAIGDDHGWGWLLVVAILAIPNWFFSYKGKDWK